MGALHEGHLSLVDTGREHADLLLMSVFLNPVQFNDATDLEHYPSTIDADIALARKHGVDILFIPEVKEFYPAFSSQDNMLKFLQSMPHVVPGTMAKGLCGASRPGHFEGVCTVVSILLNIANPEVAVFGEKDFQQLKVIEQMINALHMPVEVVAGKIVREADGLALSSRNVLLTEAQREDALSIYKSLMCAKQSVDNGESSVDVVRQLVEEQLKSSGELLVDYIEIVREKDLSSLKEIREAARLMVAVFCGSVRLIDNIDLVPG